MGGAKLKIKILDGNFSNYQYIYPDDSGFDLYAADGALIPTGGEVVTVRTGIAIELPLNTELQIRGKSGLTKQSIICPTGTVDEGYRGEIKVGIQNFGKCAKIIRKGTRIAQAVVCPVLRPQIVIVDELSETERGDNGFGSTGLF